MTTSRHKLAARELCRLRGVDPDERVPSPMELISDGIGPAIMRLRPAWQMAEREIIDAERIRAALAYAERIGNE